MTSLVLFDCDGVLIDSEYLMARAESQWFHAHGRALSAEDVIARYSGLSSASQSLAFEAEFGEPLPDDFEASVHAIAQQSFEAELRAIEGVEQALEMLPQQRCVASSTAPHRLRWTLELTGLYDRFAPHIFSASMVERGKPAPDLFLYAAGQLGVRAECCVVVEDSRFGVEAARAAGMRALGFVGGRHCGPDHGQELIAAGAERVFDDMSRLSELVG